MHPVGPLPWFTSLAPFVIATSFPPSLHPLPLWPPHPPWPVGARLLPRARAVPGPRSPQAAAPWPPSAPGLQHRLLLLQGGPVRSSGSSGPPGLERSPPEAMCGAAGMLGEKASGASSALTRGPVPGTRLAGLHVVACRLGVPLAGLAVSHPGGAGTVSPTPALSLAPGRELPFSSPGAAWPSPQEGI